MYNHSFSSLDLSQRPKRERRYGNNAIILDIGTYGIKLRRVIGGNGMEILPPFATYGDNKVGHDALAVRMKHGSALKLASPFDTTGHLVSNYEVLSFLALRSFQRELQLDVEKGRVSLFISDAVVPSTMTDSRDYHRANIAKMLTEKFDCEAFSICSQPILAVQKYNLQSGVVIDVGHTHTKVTVVFQGATIQSCTFFSPIAGNFMDDLLLKRLAGKGVSTDRDRFLLSEVKHKHLFATARPVTDDMMKKDLKREVVVGNITVELEDERYLIPESFFDPENQRTGYSNSESLRALIKKAKTQYDIFQKRASVNNHLYRQQEALSVFDRVVITGGTTRMSGFIERVMFEYRNALGELEFDDSRAEPDPFRETKEEYMAGLRTHFFFENNLERRGYDSFYGGVKFCEEAENDSWIIEKDFEDDFEDLVRMSCQS